MMSESDPKPNARTSSVINSLRVRSIRTLAMPLASVSYSNQAPRLGITVVP